VVCKIQFLEPEGPPGPAGYTGEPITLTLKDADIRDVLKTLSVVGRREIVIDEGVSGKVTVETRDVPWDQALDLVLRINGLGWVTEGNTLRVAPLDKLSQAKRVRTEATINLPRGTEGSATIASRGDAENPSVVLVVESVAGEPDLVAERDGLLHPPAFAVVAAKAGDDLAREDFLVFRGRTQANGDLTDVEVLGGPGGSKEASLLEVCRMSRPWTVLDEQVRRVEAVVGYGLRITPSPPQGLEPVHVAVAENVGIEMDIAPPPPKVAKDHPGVYVISVYVRNLDTEDVIFAPRITVRKGEEATVRSSIPGPDGQSSAFEMKILIAEDASRVSYSWTITRDGDILSSHKAGFQLQ
jgi:hypothetical protein